MSPPIPPGVDLNDDQNPQLIKSVVACCILSGLALAGRLASRKIQKSNFMASDYLVTAGLVGSWVISGLTIDTATLGLGQHIEVVPPRHVELIVKHGAIVSVFYALTLTLIKISILLFYREIFVGTKFVFLTYFIGAFVLAWFVGNEVLEWLNCPGGKCNYVKPAVLWQSLSNIGADVAILCLPLGKVLQLQMSLRLKVAVAGIFLLGGFVTIVSIIRFIIVLRFDVGDITWSYGYAYVWTCVEVNIGVVSACLPVSRPLVPKLYPAAFVRRVFGNQISKRATVDSGISSYILDRFSRLEEGEELQRLPDHTPEAMPGWHEPETGYTPVPKPTVDEYELGRVAEPHDGIAVHESFATYRGG